MADADTKVSQQEINDNLDRILHQTRGTLALMVSHPELNKLDNTLLCYALWGVEDKVKTVHEHLRQLNAE